MAHKLRHGEIAKDRWLLQTMQMTDLSFYQSITSNACICSVCGRVGGQGGGMCVCGVCVCVCPCVRARTNPSPVMHAFVECVEGGGGVACVCGVCVCPCVRARVCVYVCVMK